MGDVDDRHTAVPQHVDDPEQVLHFLFCQGRRRFVEDDDLGVEGDRLGDFHHLPGSHGHRAHDLLRIHVDFQFLEDFLRVFHHFLFVHNAHPGGIAPQPDVVHDIAFQGLVQFLVNHGYAVFQGFLGVFEADLLAIQEDRPVVLAVDTKQTLHQGGFPRTVFPHQGVDGAFFHIQTDTIQCLDTRKLFCDVLHLQQDGIVRAACRCIHCVSFLARLPGQPPAGILRIHTQPGRLSKTKQPEPAALFGMVIRQCKWSRGC